MHIPIRLRLFAFGRLGMMLPTKLGVVKRTTRRRVRGREIARMGEGAGRRGEAPSPETIAAFCNRPPNLGSSSSSKHKWDLDLDFSAVSNSVSTA